MDNDNLRYLSTQQKLLLAKNGLNGEYCFQQHFQSVLSVETLSENLIKILNAVDIFKLDYDDTLSFQFISKELHIELKYESATKSLVTAKTNKTKLNISLAKNSDDFCLDLTTNNTIFDQRSISLLTEMLKDDNKFRYYIDNGISYLDYIDWLQSITEENMNAVQHNIANQHVRYNFETKNKKNTIGQHQINLAKAEILSVASEADVSLKSLILTAFLHVLGYYTSNDQLRVYGYVDNADDPALSNMLGNLTWFRSYNYTSTIANADDMANAAHKISDAESQVSINDAFLQFIKEMESNHYNTIELAAVYEQHEINTSIKQILTTNAVNNNQYLPCQAKIHLCTKVYTDAIQLQLYYAKDYIPTAIAETLLQLINQYLSNPNAYLELPPADCYDELINSTNKQLISGKMKSLDSSASLSTCIDNVLTNNANKTLLSDFNSSFTGSEIATKLESYYHTLLKNGVQPDHKVCILLDRGLSAILWLLASFKIGATAIPIDTNSHQHHINTIIDDVKPNTIISQQAISCSTHATLITNEIAEASTSENRSVCTTTAPRGDSIAYIVYTSGTTGQPKAAQISYRAFANYCKNLQDTIKVTATARYAVTAAFGFSSFFRQIFMPLLNSAEAVLYYNEARTDPAEFINFSRAKNITVVDIIPSFAESIIRYIKDQQVDVASLPISHALFASEPLSATTAINFARYFKQTNMINMYGQTETSGIATCYPIDISTLHKSLVPIGYPIENTKAVILDDNFKISPPYSVGQLAIASPSLASSLQTFQLNHNHVTNQWYLTGDMVYVDQERQLNFVTRQDSQIKINGKRLSLMTIDETLESHPACAKAVTLFDDNKKILFAYIQSADHQNPSQIELRHHLGLCLPFHMIPALFFYKDEFELTRNGKLDINALQTSYQNYTKTVSQSKEDYTECFNSNIEKELYYVISDILNLVDIKRDDNFIALGTNSLKSTTIIHEANVRFGISLKLTDIFTCSTIAELAEKIEELAASNLS